MCGIAGFINYSNGEDLVRLANVTQKHRGPDDQSELTVGNISLAHQRLSIIDLNERSNQPFVKDGLIIVFNGEIYNYKEIRERLIQHGTNFSTTSDTEVVLESYRKWGNSCLQHFIGMFSFALIEKDTGKLFLARDHFGIKPLYFRLSNNQFAFASELKTLLKSGGSSKSIDSFSLLATLNYLWIPGNRSIVKGIEKLPPAHFLELKTQESILKPSVHRYWQWQVSSSAATESEIKEELSRVLQESVKRHMVADVPVSSFLSGGLDSSLISVLAAKHNARLSTYTIGTRAEDKRIERMPDDEKYADQLAKMHGFDHHKIILDPSLAKKLPQFVSLFDEPIGDPAAINTYLICKQARDEGVKVLLSGMGADELFFGYRRQYATLLASQYQRLPRLIKKPIEFTGDLLPVKFNNKGFKQGRWMKRFLSFASLPIEKAYRRSYSYYGDDEYESFLQEDFTREIELLNEQHHALFYEHPMDIQNQMCYTDVNMFMTGLNLAYSDRASMAASVEVRVPFIDREVVTLALSIPGEYKYRKGESKYILKKVAADFLPNEIVYRKKASFGAPIRSWISSDLKEMVDDLLSEERIKRRGIFNYNFVCKLINDDRQGLVDNAYQIYQLLILELWFDEYLNK